ncbi:MAG: cyclic nucleotide-binding protein [Hyphomicrobiales bacterium]|nr:MAG: cyclic nucleotide-binding protein [Hyphomicrobiales bacterium]
MAISDDIALLSKVELLQGFDIEQLRLLAFGAPKRTLVAGEELYQQGTITDGGFVIISGQIDLVTTIGGKQVILGNYGPGSLIGEMAMITKTTRITSAFAHSNTQLIRLSRTIFLRVLEEFPDLAVRLHDKISDSVNDIVEKMDQVRTKLEREEL